MWTKEQLERARAKEISDRRTFKRMILTVVLMSACFAGFIAMDLFFTPIVSTQATVFDKNDNWSLKYGDRCKTIFTTALGFVEHYSFRTCAQMPWQIGQKMELHVRKGRITKSIDVYGGDPEIVGAASSDRPVE